MRGNSNTEVIKKLKKERKILNEIAGDPEHTCSARRLRVIAIFVVLILCSIFFSNIARGAFRNFNCMQRNNIRSLLSYTRSSCSNMRRFTSTVPARSARAPNRAISNSCL